MYKTIIKQIQIQLPSGTTLYLNEEDLRDLHLKLNEMFGTNTLGVPDHFYQVLPVQPLFTDYDNPYEIRCGIGPDWEQSPMRKL